MAKLKLSPWHEKGIKPFRKGVYEVIPEPYDFPENQWYSYWNGERFGFVHLSGPLDAYKCRLLKTCQPHLLKWRGILK